MKTKTEELAILRDAAERLGPDSYLGPWLLSRIEAIEHAILGDVMPLWIDPVEAMREARETTQAAMREASEIRDDAIQDAKVEAARIIARATRDADETREHLRWQIQALISAARAVL